MESGNDRRRLMMRVPKLATLCEKLGPGQDMNIRVVGIFSRWANAAMLDGVKCPLTKIYQISKIRTADVSRRNDRGSSDSTRMGTKRTRSTVISGKASSRTVLWSGDSWETGVQFDPENGARSSSHSLFQFASISDGMLNSSS